MSERSRQRSPSLEGEVMALLWSAGAPLTPGEVQRHLARNLAYTTVMTTLARLYAKGQVTRAKRGRAFAYTPVQRAEDHAAQAMTDLLGNGDDPTAVLSRFVERLRPQEEQVLRRLLERSQPPKD